MLSTNKRHIAYLAEYCIAAGIEEIVISPGSRNAPLILAFKGLPSINCILIHDERVAAFVALGIAEAKKKPVALTCTSGSALLNYSPAIAEAYYRQIPLVIFSADRPAELIDQGDGQTIRQFEVYKNFIKKSFQLPDSENENCFELSKSMVNDVFATLVSAPFGPVHVNIPLREPLYGVSQVEEFKVTLAPKVQSVAELEDSEANFIRSVWNNSARKMVLVGQHEPDLKILKVIQELSQDPSVAILVENTSNLFVFGRVVHCIDRTLAAIREEEMNDFRPDLLITLGGAVISKRIKSFLRATKPANNWRVGNYTIQEDTYQSLTKAYEVDPTLFLGKLVGLENTLNSNFGGKWKQKDMLAQEAHQDFMSTSPYSDLSVFNVILDSIPDDINLHMANSSVVRYCQLFDPVRGHAYFSNRGVSGIDGSASTAGGYSMGSKSKLNILVTGDTSFFYDSNAFWNENLTDDFKIIVINNGGGGIFQIIDGPVNSPQAETFFAPFSASVKGVCDTYNLNYFVASSFETLSQSFEEFIFCDKNSRPSVLEIHTENCNNGEVLKQYFDALAK